MQGDAVETPQFFLETIFVFIYNLIFGEGSGDTLFQVWDTVNVIATFTAPLFFLGMVYVAIRMRQMRTEEKERFQAQVQKAKGESKGSERWKRIVDLVSSDNPTEWRHGVIEADVLLDELLTDHGYVGESLGEKLKNVSTEGLRSLDAAWEAHKIRNEIAHAGSDFILTQREARRAIDNYRQVFEEWGAV